MNGEVGWYAELDDPVAFPALERDVVADLCVVGLGASGLSAALAGVERGLSVVGLDAGTVAAGAAGRNGGFLLAGPSPAPHVAAQRWGEDATVELYRRTLDEIERWRAVLGDDVVRPTGSIRLAGLPGEPSSDAEATDRDADLDDCRQEHDFLLAHGFPVEKYSGELGEGLYLPANAAMNPAVRAHRLARRCAPPARLFEHTPVVGVTPGAVRTANAVVHADRVVVAVDGRLERLLPALADRVRTARLQMAATAPITPGRLPCPVFARWGYDYAQQTPTGRMFLGGGRDLFADEEWTSAREPSAPVQEYIDEAALRFAGGPVTVTHRWAASVSYTPDARPLLTEVAPGVAACGAYSGTGNLIGTLAGRCAVELVVDGVPAPSFFAG